MSESTQDVERMAKVICDAVSGHWRHPPYNALHADALNNIWRRAAEIVLREVKRPAVDGRADALARQVEECVAALKPFARYYDLNDCAERDDDALEVPVRDLRRARDTLARIRASEHAAAAMETAAAHGVTLDPRVAAIKERGANNASAGHEKSATPPVVDEAMVADASLAREAFMAGYWACVTTKAWTGDAGPTLEQQSWEAWQARKLAAMRTALEAALRPEPQPAGAETFETIRQWGEETFGPITAERAFCRAAEEWREMHDAILEHGFDAPEAIEEAADVIICLMRLPGMAQTIERKMATNRGRQWALRGDGTGYHVKGGEPPTTDRSA